MLVTKGQTRVSPAKTEGSGSDKGTLEHNEWHLVLDDVSRVTLAKFGDTVAASGEDEGDGGGETGEEGLEAPGETGHAAGAPVSEHVVGKGGDEGDEDGDLEGETGHGDVDAGFIPRIGVGGHGTSGGLENETDDIGGDEDPVKELGLEP